MSRTREQIGNATLYLGDCLEILPTLDESSIDSIVTDPPYGLSFMGKAWDHSVPSVEVWKECLRVLKPGGHLLAFAGTRTQHRMAVAIEDAGFEIRDMIAWVYGSGFPKSLDVSKAIDKAAGAEREVVAIRKDGRGASPSKLSNHGPGDTGIGHADGSNQVYGQTAPATKAARQWSGWGTALKPALEPITVARKPLTGTVAANVQAHGTGALNIDGCRIDGPMDGVWGSSNQKCQEGRSFNASPSGDNYRSSPHSNGRWPANLIHDGSDEVVAAFPDAKGQQGKVGPEHGPRDSVNCYGDYGPRPDTPPRIDASASTARFFYCAKASKSDRDPDNTHPTVKPTDLMRYLCRLVTPPGGTVLDPFTGSGSTGKAAALEGFRFIGIEIEEESFAIATKRVKPVSQGSLFT